MSTEKSSSKKEAKSAANSNKKQKLAPMQDRFCSEYLVDLNGTQAAIRAGYSEKSAHAEASRLLKNVKVHRRVQELKEERAKRLEIQSDNVLRELAHLGHSDIRGLIDESGCVIPVHEWPEELARAVSSIKVREEFEDGFRLCGDCAKNTPRTFVGFTKEVKFWDKPKSLELMGKHKKLFTEKHEHSGPDGKPIETRDVPMTEQELDAKIATIMAKMGIK